MSSSATPSSRIGWGVMAGEEVTLYSEVLEFSHLFACSSRFRFEFRAGHRLLSVETFLKNKVSLTTEECRTTSSTSLNCTPA